MAQKYQRLTMNLVPSVSKRYELLDGKRYLVVPAVMATEGVHNGSEGPLYYSKSELGKNPEAWNHKPVVIYHPTLNGEGISACNPSVVKNQGVGILFNTGFDGRLKTEVWLDMPKLKTVDNRVHTSVQNNEMVEISTGLFNDPDMTPGEWNGEKYNGSVKGIVPDHLAILPDQIGACSIKDGAGLLRNADNSSELSYEDLRTQLRILLKEMHEREEEVEGEDSYYDYFYCYVCDIFQTYAVYEADGNLYSIKYKIKDGRVSLSGQQEPVYRKVTYITASGDTVRCSELESVRHALATEHPQMGRIVNLTDSYVVCNTTGGPFRLKYEIKDGTIKFTGEPELDPEETNVTTPATGGNGKKSSTNNPGVTNRDVSSMIGAGKFSENDRGFLEGLSEDDWGRVSKIGVVLPPPPPPMKTVPEVMDILDAPTHRTPQIGNAAPVTVEQYLQDPNIPFEVRQLVTNGLATARAEREQLITNIMSSPNNRFTKEWLETIKDINQLRGMAALAGQAQQAAAQAVQNGTVSMFIDNMPFKAPSVGQGRVLEQPKPDFSHRKVS